MVCSRALAVFVDFFCEQNQIATSADLAHCRKNLRQAEAVFSRGTDYAPDLARVQYRMGRVLTEQGDRNSAGLMLLKAADARFALVGDTRSPNELTDADFDELVAFWVR